MVFHMIYQVFQGYFRKFLKYLRVSFNTTRLHLLVFGDDSENFAEIPFVTPNTTWLCLVVFEMTQGISTMGISGLTPLVAKKSRGILNKLP